MKNLENINTEVKPVRTNKVIKHKNNDIGYKKPKGIHPRTSEKINTINTEAVKKAEEMLVTKFRGATIIIGLKTKLLQEDGFKLIEVLPTSKNAAEGKKGISFKYKDIKYDIFYLFSTNNETVTIRNEFQQHKTIHNNELVSLSDIKLIELIIEQIKIISNFKVQ